MFVVFMNIWKKGLSPVIASVLMIMLVLFIASFVFSWARGFVMDEDRGNGLSADALCNSVDFDVGVIGIDGDDYSFEAVNRGNVNISALKFKVYSGEDSSIVDSDVGILTERSITGNVVFSGVVDKVDTFSVLDGKLTGGNSDIVCLKVPVNLKGI